MKFKDKYIHKFYAFALAAVFAIALAGCGGGGGTAETPEPPPMPTPKETCEAAGNHYVDGACLTPAQVTFNTALAKINAAATAEAAQAAYDEVKDDVTATAGDMLQAAVNARIMAIQTAARVADQKMALADAAGMIDTSDLSTQELVDAARAAIAGLRGAIAAAVDVDDTSMYQSMLDDAVDAVDEAEGGIKTATRRMNQMDALSGASMTLQAALAALSGSTPTQAQLDAANAALTALNAAIAAGADLTDSEKATYVREAANAAAPINTAQMAFDAAEDAAKKKADADMMATAKKLRPAIKVPAGDGSGNDDYHAAYNDANTTGSAVNGVPANTAADTLVMVTIGAGDAPGTPVPLSEDKKTTVAANHGWAGKRYARTKPASDGTYEAIVYSNVEAPKEGRKFGSAAAVTETGAYEYQLDAADRDGTANKALTIVPATHAARVSLTGVTRTAGTETFELSTGQNLITVPGTLHGVSGVFSCAPTTLTDGCTAAVAAKGFTLGGGTWLFIPSNAEARVMDSADANYASYGWWIHKAANDGDFTASAFHDVKGNVSNASGLDALNGTATYMGGAAGKYSIYSSTGGTNDAGHFTARATLEADFTNNTAATAITGTIDMFMGADGKPRDWEVELKGSAIGDDGAIGDTEGNNGTVWTIGGTAASARGQWSGMLRDNGTDGVPKVATGTFNSEYHNTGKMVGGFGATRQ